MLRIAVCDDIPRYTEDLANIIGSWSDVRGIHVQLKKFVSGEDLLFDLECAGDFAAVFMDIKLSGNCRENPAAEQCGEHCVCVRV